MSLLAHLQALDDDALAELLVRRSDVLVEPVPRDLAELADRLDGIDSLDRALSLLDADELTVVRTSALLGAAPLSALAESLGNETDAVVARLAGRGLLWSVGDRVGVPDGLAAYLTEEIRRFRPLAAIAKQARVEDLRAAVGGDIRGLTKPRLVERLAERLADRGDVLAAITALSPPARHHLELILQGGILFSRAGERELQRAGLLIPGPYARGEVPREVVVALLLGDGGTLTGQPDIAAASGALPDGRAGGESAVRALTALLDDAGAAPLARLKKGGIGVRERGRLASRLGLEEPALWIDVAAALGLLGAAGPGYVPGDAYAGWREGPVATRWASAAQAWWALEVAPTSRQIDDGEVAPPEPLESVGGLLRRALLRAAAGGRSLASAAAGIDWFCPVHHDDDVGRTREVDAALTEARLLGVLDGDRLTALGEALVAGRGDLAAQVAYLLPESRGGLVLQSDLSAVVSGQVGAAAMEVLTAAAAPEGRGAATTWRFSPGSVRAALDAGWTVDELRARLVEVSGRELPQPLDYLLDDVACRHGTVRVRPAVTCLTGPAAELAEIRHTRALKALRLTELAPTVLTSVAAPDAVLAALRKAGFAPVGEDADGIVQVTARKAQRAAPTRPRPVRPRVPAAELVTRLRTGPAVPASGTRAQLVALGPHLRPAEIALLADAVDHGRVVRIRYRNSAGNHSVRDVTPLELWDRHVTAWCHLRDDQRDFAVRGIEVVGPV